ncbi:Tripeptidyl-peptidase sed2 [Echria macrotheca]|uniref:tripeptidyl-peptidase II n=1 Tax=Echria macrotheca TaxID=438768 RepID=A0AAJ0BLB8_9PEZI|nr:Tripeptidyl-peptidase sed2 [Echria macrotheca]
MWHCVSWVLLGLSIAPIYGAPTVILENTEGLPTGWTYHSKADVSEVIVLSVVLREPGIHELKNRLSRRGDPRHPDFGSRHLSREEVNHHRKPDRKVTDAVSSWLRSSGIRNMQVQGSMISFPASVATVKSIFHADLAHYSYGKGSKPVLRALNYTVPTWLRNDIEFVHPITNFITPRRGGRNKTPKVTVTSSSPEPTLDTPIGNPPPAPEPDYPCLTGSYPECIRQLYNITYNQTAPSPVRFGVAGFLEQTIHYGDVSQFLSDLAPELVGLEPAYNFTVELFNGAENPQPESQISGIEAALDVEYALALGYPANVTYYLTGGRGVKLGPNGTAIPEDESDNEPYLEFLTAMLAKPDHEIPHVLSISYADDEIGVPLPYARRVCDLFAALTARGVSIFSAAGDGGAAGTGETKCTSNDGSQRKMYMPTFPASCPYVTSVGATDNVAPPLSGADFSSGGFSNYFARPAWQRDVVDPYVQKLVDAKDERLPLFNQTGRASPDISAVGSGFQTVQNANFAAVLGTSASTPVVAAMVALVNDARLRAGKPSLGWLNPVLYTPRVRSKLRDVTTGRSSGCWFPDGTTAPGWRAVKGYDPVTGLGTVEDFNEFLKVLME